MRPELERLRRLEQHLLGPALTDSAECLPLDAALPGDAEAQRQVYNALHRAGQRQLRQELLVIHERLYGPGVGCWTWVAAAAGLRRRFVRWARGGAKS